MSGMPVGPLFIRCDAGREDGLGHLSRCLVLADGLKVRLDQPPRFVTYDPDGIGERMVKDRGFPSWRSPAVAGADDDLAFVLDALKRARAESDGRPLLVIDSRRIDENYARYAGYQTFTICLDDEEMRDLPCNLLINNHVWVSADDYPARKERRVLAGPLYNLIPQPYFKIPQRQSEAGKPVRILITLGGEDPHNHTAWILHNLADLLASHTVTIVLGPAHPDPVATKLMARTKLPRAQVIDSPTSLASHMAVVDLAITAGGITCYELAAARIAQLAIIVEDHQRPMVKALEERGCLAILGSYDDLAAAPIREKLTDYLESPEHRGTLAVAAAELFPESGVGKVCDALLQAYEQMD